MTEKKYKFETIEEYREYMKLNSKKWYANPENAEKKKAYQKAYYQKRRLKKLKKVRNNK